MAETRRCSLRGKTVPKKEENVSPDVPKKSGSPFTEEDTQYLDERLQLKLLSEKKPFVWVYRMDHPIDPPEYIPGFHLKLPLKYTFEFIFPNLFRRMRMLPPSIPVVYLYWTCRNPSVLRLLMEKMTCSCLGIVVDSFKRDRAVRILFWKVGLVALFGCHDASSLLRYAAFKLLKGDFRTAFYLYIAAMTRITKKLKASENPLKCRDRDFEINLRLNTVRKHPRVKKRSSITKLKCHLICSCILKTRSLIKKVFRIKSDQVKKMFKKTNENLKLFTFENRREKASRERIATEIFYDIEFSDCGVKSTDKDFKYQCLLREFDDEYMRKCVFKIVMNDHISGTVKEPVPHSEKDLENFEYIISKMIYLNFPSESINNQEHGDNCIGSLMNPDISYLTEQVMDYMFKSAFEPEPDFDIPIKCMEIQKTKDIFQSILSSSLKSQFTYMPRDHPILKLPLKYLDIDLHFLGVFITMNMIHKDKKREAYKRFATKLKKK